MGIYFECYSYMYLFTIQSQYNCKQICCSFSFEIALQRVRRNAALCYWDTTFEFRLGRENWAWTSAFSDEMFGNAFGEVTSGPFRDWLLPAPNTNRILQRRLLDREVDRTGNRGSPVDPRAVEAMFLNPQLNTISSVTVGGTGGIFLTNR